MYPAKVFLPIKGAVRRGGGPLVISYLGYSANKVVADVSATLFSVVNAGFGDGEFA